MTILQTYPQELTHLVTGRTGQAQASGLVGLGTEHIHCVFQEENGSRQEKRWLATTGE